MFIESIAEYKKFAEENYPENGAEILEIIAMNKEAEEKLAVAKKNTINKNTGVFPVFFIDRKC